MTWVVLPGTLVSQSRWRSIALSVAFGSALGATALVLVFHHWGWSWVYARFPEFASQASWRKIVGWVSVYGIPGLFAIALSPLPQTPALVVFGIVDPQPAAVFVTIRAAKVIKYGIVAWFVSRFPERFHGGRRGLLGRVRLRNRP